MKYIIINMHDDPHEAIGPFVSKGTALDWVESIFKEIGSEFESPSYGETITRTGGRSRAWEDVMSLSFHKVTPASSGSRSTRKAWYEIMPLTHPND